MQGYLQRRWFLISLALAITVGLCYGSQSSGEEMASLTAWIPPRVVTAIVLFLMSVSLDSRHLRAALLSPAPVAWSTMVNYGLIPLMAWGLTFCQLLPDFGIGLMIAGSVPCTMAAASVWTRRACGNDAVSLLVTLLTNTACFAVTPFWLQLATAQDVSFDTWMMVDRLVKAALIPIVLGQLLRLFPVCARFATRNKVPLGVVAQFCVLSLVLTAALNAGTRFHTESTTARPGIIAVVVVWASCIAIHLVAMAVGYFGGRRFGFSAADLRAVAFASSQKTLPIGVLLATEPSLFGGMGVPFAVFPMLMYHASQLFVDTHIADRLAREHLDASADEQP